MQFTVHLEKRIVSTNLKLGINCEGFSLKCKYEMIEIVFNNRNVGYVYIE